MDKGKSAPAAPDPYRTAQAQGQENRQSALYNAMLNRVNTNTPLGSQSYNITGTDPTTGAPIYEQNIELDPQVEQAYRQQLGQNMELGGAAGGFIDQIQGQQPFSLSGLPQRGQLNTEGLPQIPTDYGDLRQQQSDALYDRSTAYLDPQFEQSESDMRSRLANQGITQGSEAFEREMSNFGREREFAYGQARNQAIAGGGEEAERAFGISSGARGQMFGEQAAGADLSDRQRQQAMAEQLTQQNLPFQQMQQIRGMTGVDMPQFQGMPTVGTQPADIAGLIQNNYGGQVDAYNARQQGSNAMTSGLFSLGGTLGAAFISDERMKEDIEPVGELNDGTSLFSYRYKGQPETHVGVMAQEVEKTQPEAVLNAGGIKAVDYRKVLSRALEAQHA